MDNIVVALKEGAFKTPDKVYIVESNQQWTYKQVYERVQGFAYLLSMHGLKPGDRCLLCMDNSTIYVITFFAILLAKGVAVPINRNNSAENISYIFEKTRAKLVITDQRARRQLESIPKLKNQLLIVDTLAELIQTENVKVDSEKIVKISKNDLALILFTSGTTRSPKGVMLSHGNLMANTKSIVQYLRLTAQDSVLVTIPFSYSYGNSLLFTHTMVHGTLYIDNNSPFPIKVLESIEKNRVTGYSTIGSYMNLLLKQNLIHNIDFSNLRYMTFAGESTSMTDVYALKKLAPHLELFIMYGQTEASARLSYLDPDLIYQKPNSIGQGIPGVRLRVVSQTGEDIKPGEVGEIIARGDNVMQGYWEDEKTTREVIKDDWLYTGDLATVDEEGFIYIKGREKEIIKYLGHRISPLEIEAVINQHESVLESAVVEDTSNDLKQITAFVVPNNSDIDVTEIQFYLRQHLPTYKRPHSIVIIENIPRTSNGKIKRGLLKS